MVLLPLPDKLKWVSIQNTSYPPCSYHLIDITQSPFRIQHTVFRSSYASHALPHCQRCSGQVMRKKLDLSFVHYLPMSFFHHYLPPKHWGIILICTHMYYTILYCTMPHCTHLYQTVPYCCVRTVGKRIATAHWPQKGSEGFWNLTPTKWGK